MEMAKVTSKGQITIPVSIRKRLGINEGDKLLFIDSPEGVVMVNPDALSTGQIVDAQRNLEKPAAPVKQMLSDESVLAKSVEDASNKVAEATSPVSPPAAAPAANAEQRPKGLDVSALLDEIRSIGLKL